MSSVFVVKVFKQLPVQVCVACLCFEKDRFLWFKFIVACCTSISPH